MTTDNRGELYTDATMRKDVTYVEFNSPDVLVDLGILFHLAYKRDWDGPYKGWTDFSVSWFAEHSKMGQRRVRAATKRLVSWGMIQECDGKGKWAGPVKRNPLKFRYGKHQPLEYEDLLEEGEQEERLLELNNKLKKGRPLLKLGASGQPVGVSHTWDKKGKQLILIEVSPVEYASHPICSGCGRVFHPTEGRGLEEGVCAECSLLVQLEKILASKKIKTAHRASVVFPNGEQKTLLDESIEKYAVRLRKIQSNFND